MSDVREIDDSLDSGWQRFVATHPEANLYHTLQWRDVIREVFGHRPRYLVCGEGNEVHGVLPLFLIKLPLLGSKLVSMPYDIGSGGALVTDDKAERALATRALEVARQARVGYLQLRCGSRRPALEGLGMTESSPVIISDVLLDNKESVWARVKPDHRKDIRKARRRGVTVREAETLDDYLEFYGIYLRVFRAFGTPPYSERYFRALWERLQPQGGVKLLLAQVEGETVGGLQMFSWNRELVSKFAACLPKAVPLRTYPALYWRAMLLGLELGYRRLSWGTSSREQKGLIQFKERWGARSRPAVLYDMPVQGRVPDLERYYDSNGFAQRIWRRLPLGATRLMGGWVNRWYC